LCKHALKVFNVNDVFILPPQYILNRWTKYAKRGFYIEKQESEKESLNTCAARISRKATSLALKCSLSKELLDDLENAIDKLDLEADNSISKMQEKDDEVPLVSADCATADTFSGKISFRIPRVVKGPKNKRGTISFEKNKGKKKKSGKKKGTDPINSSIFSWFLAIIINFICLKIGQDTTNAVENRRHEDANLEQFTVSHMP